MPTDPPRRTRKDTFAREVDRLLRQLPGGAPTPRGDDAAQPPGATRPGEAGRPLSGMAAIPRHPEPSPLAQKLGVWVRALLAAGVGVAASQWPYVRACGGMLWLYLGVVATVLIAGGWAAAWSWRVRVAAAHLLALIVVFWGIVLAAEQILPRIGYAADAAAWECEAPEAAP